MRDQIDESLAFASRRGFEQLNQIGGLLSRERKGRNTKGCAFGNVLAIGL
jgi:hypothetical protein